jgi:hypothetical protein
VRYPIGARWKAQEDDWEYEVWLDKASDEFHVHQEVWMVDIRAYDETKLYEAYYSKSAAFAAARGYMNKHETRFKRVDNKEIGTC